MTGDLHPLPANLGGGTGSVRLNGGDATGRDTGCQTIVLNDLAGRLGYSFGTAGAASQTLGVRGLANGQLHGQLLCCT